MTVVYLHSEVTDPLQHIHSQFRLVGIGIEHDKPLLIILAFLNLSTYSQFKGQYKFLYLLTFLVCFALKESVHNEFPSLVRKCVHIPAINIHIYTLQYTVEQVTDHAKQCTENIHWMCQDDTCVSHTSGDKFTDSQTTLYVVTRQYFLACHFSN